MGHPNVDPTPFVGRDSELRQLAGAIDRPEGLLTVVGPGGMGKTRLAREAADRARGIFVDASHATTRDGLVGAVARRLLGPGPVDASVTGVAQALRHLRPPVVVVDNLEQLFDVLPETLGIWLRTVPETAWLATSRRPLDLPGERCLHLSPLPGEEGTELFVNAAPALVRGSLDRARVRAIVELLDAMPLALEIAAARLGVLPLDALIERLGAQLAVLGDPVGRRPARHRSLEATLRWSWDLLEGWQQQALAQVSVFPGAFALDAAEAVLSLPPPWTALDALHSLVTHSLVQARDPGFSMLSITRRFAAERLPADRRTAAELRHAQWAIEHTTALRDASKSGEIEATQRFLEPPSPDLEVALLRALERRDRPTALAALPLVFPAFVARSELRRLDDLIQQVLALPGDEADLVPALRWRSRILPALQELEEGRRTGEALLRLGGDSTVSSGAAHLVLAQCTRGPAAIPHWEAVAASPHAMVRGEGLIGLAYVACRAGDVDGAIALCDQAAALHRELGARGHLSHALLDLAAILPRAGRHDEAIEAAEEALTMARARGNLRDVCTAVLVIAQNQVATGQVAAGIARLDEILGLCRSLGYVTGQVAGATVRAVARAMLHDPSATEDADEAERWLDGVERRENVLLLASLLAGVWAPADAERAVRLLDRARSEVEADPDLTLLNEGTPVRSVIGGAEGLLRSARPFTRAELREVRATLRRIADGPADSTGLGLLAGLARARLSQLPGEEPFRIALDGTWFEPPDGPTVDLHHRVAPCGVLAALARAHEHGREVPREELFEAGWPGERILEKAAGSRVRVALSQLRRAGLDIIERGEGGWRLDPSAPVWIVPAEG